MFFFCSLNELRNGDLCHCSTSCCLFPTLDIKALPFQHIKSAFVCRKANEKNFFFFRNDKLILCTLKLSENGNWDKFIQTSDNEQSPQHEILVDASMEVNRQCNLIKLNLLQGLLFFHFVCQLFRVLRHQQLFFAPQKYACH